MRHLLVLALALPGAALAGGFLGSDTPTRIPVPARVFSATVHDVSGAAVEVTKITCGGQIFVAGKVGEADVAVPFENIDRVRIEPTDDDQFRMAYITLRSGKKAKVIVEHDDACHAEAVFGNYRIEAEKIREVIFDAPPPR